jgi:hypothetical protein
MLLHYARHIRFNVIQEGAHPSHRCLPLPTAATAAAILCIDLS